MKEIDLSKVNKVYFIGIGGIGVSAIARMMLAEGKWVGGSDTSQSEITDELTRLGAHITIGQSAGFVPDDTDLVIYTIAIATYDPALLEAIQKKGIQAITYPQALGIISKDKYTIAVSGTHGKTTTTAMIAKLLIDTKNDPTVVVGSLLKDVKSNFVAGRGKYFVAEACEYRRSFLNLSPSILVITNIDNDHLDYYKDIDDIISAFHEMALRVPADGFVVCNPNDVKVKRAVSGIKAQVIDYTKFDDGSISLLLPGKHNRENAAAVSAVAHVLGVDKEEAGESLARFSGTLRRFEFKGKTKHGALIYDDYAHNPQKIRAALQGARELYPNSNIIVLFQPHLFSRTKLLLDDFAKSFVEADEVLLLPIFPAREVFDSTISSGILAEKIFENELGKWDHTNLLDFYSSEEAIQYLTEELGEGDVLITMGAGEQYKIGDELLK